MMEKRDAIRNEILVLRAQAGESDAWAARDYETMYSLCSTASRTLRTIRLRSFLNSVVDGAPSKSG